MNTEMLSQLEVVITKIPAGKETFPQTDSGWLINICMCIEMYRKKFNVIISQIPFIRT